MCSSGGISFKTTEKRANREGFRLVRVTSVMGLDEHQVEKRLCGAYGYALVSQCAPGHAYSELVFAGPRLLDIETYLYQVREGRKVR